MASSFLMKRIISSNFSFHYQHQLALLSPLLLRHSLSTQPHHQQVKQLPFIAHYLISFFAFSHDRALKYSADSYLASIKSSEWPESVVTFLKDTGLSHDQIQAVVSLYPPLLGFNVEKTLKPKVCELMEGGFSRELLVQLFRYNPTAFYLKGTLSRLLFWRNFVGNNEEVLLNIVKKNGFLITYNVDKYVFPRINLFKEYGLSSRDIAKHRSLGQNLDSLRQTLELIEELGISRGSRKFVSRILAILGYNKDKIRREVEFFMVTYGWSEEEVHAAFRKFPGVLALSEDKVKLKMVFLIRKAGFESRDIALQAVLLGYSLERVLIPRYTVLSVLQAKGFKTKCSLLSACLISERRFHETYVVRYEKDVHGLGEAYAVAYGGEVPI